MAFSQNLKKIRENRNLSQVQLAKELGVSVQSVSNWERGQVLPKSKYVSDAAKVLGVTTNDLLDEKEQFISDAYQNYGIDGRNQAEKLIQDTQALFFGGEISEEDIDTVFRTLTEMYWDAKEIAKKYGRKANPSSDR